MPESALESRVHAYALPAVKDFTSLVQMQLQTAHFRRYHSPRGMSYERASYLLHAHAGYVQPREADREALADLVRILEQGGEPRCPATRL